ncbi:hypothetical protein VTN77DRAFT_9429 [Rasamsonia byssochlamydoides]|uniref:uncharacterized protein n=1 Tax=Rasamsonia byssochlamydoides TaxID=89139 RepID=UPI003742EA3B
MVPCIHPTELSALYSMLPASLRRRIPRFDSLHRSILSSRGLHRSPSTRDSYRGFVSASESELEYYDSREQFLGDPSRPTTADGQESLAAGSSSGRSSHSGTSTPEVDRSTVSSSNYETDSGLRWNRIVPAFNLLRNAGFEAQQPNSDSRLVRTLYIHGLFYLLEALPDDLTSDEVRCIQDRLPEPVKSTLPEAEADNSRSQPGKPVRFPGPHHPPSYLHRIVATVIVYGFLLAQFLIPYAKAFLQNVYRYERNYRITERLVALTLDTADSLGKGGASFGSALVRLSEGRLGAAVSGFTAWWIEGIAGGIYEGVAEGMVIQGSMRPNTELQRQSF